MTRDNIIVLVAVIVIIVLFFIGYSEWQRQQALLAGIPPNAPSDLNEIPMSATEVKLIWKDNSSNENGFRIYRDGTAIFETEKDREVFVDRYLRPATSYTYKIEAFNSAGKSQTIDGVVRTLNPPINIWLDKIGVENNGEEGEIFRQFDMEGEVYVVVRACNGSSPLTRRLPEPSGIFGMDKVYHLKRNQVILTNTRVFAIDEVSDNLTMIAVGVEDDGGAAEQLIYSVLDQAFKRSMGNPMSLLLNWADVDFAPVFAGLTGADDDFMGEYKVSWSAKDYWGIGNYDDIKCIMKNGGVGLRLWFRVECPVYDYSQERMEK